MDENENHCRFVDAVVVVVEKSFSRLVRWLPLHEYFAAK